MGPPAAPSGLTVTNAVDTVGGVPIVVAGEAANFSVALSDSASCVWDFGDGTSSTGPVASHVYSDCGPYTVTATISDGSGTTKSELPVAVPCAMAVTNFQAKLNFAKPNRDSCKFQAVPQVSQCTNWAGSTLTVDVGGAQVAFALNAKGRGVSTNGTCRFSYNKATDSCVLKVNLKRGSWQDRWAAHGMVQTEGAKSGTAVTLPVILLLNNEAFMTEQTLSYTATANSSGTAR